MPLTITRDAHFPLGTSGRITFGRITWDNSYLTDGEVYTPENFGYSQLKALYPFPSSATLAGVKQTIVPVVDHAAKKLLAFEQGVRTGSTAAADSTSGALAESSAGTETALRAMGTAIDQNYNLGGLKQVASAVDLSAVTHYYIALGH